MASDKAFVEYIVDQIENAGEVTYKHMFGEYGVFCDGKIFGLICDNKLFIKPTDSGRKFIGDVVEAPPYTGAKNSFLIGEKIDDREWLSTLVKVTVAELPEPKPKRKKKSRKMKNLFILLVFLVVMIQCKKDNNPDTQKTDYRDVFCGDFAFNTVAWWDSILDTIHYDTTNFNSTITKLDNTDSLISVRYKPGDNNMLCDDFSYGTNISITISPGGKLIYDNALGCPGIQFDGSFRSKDTVEIIITQTALGGISGDKILGIRIKK